MSKLYNTQADFASTFNEFLINCVPFLRKTQLNILPHTIWGIINAESSVASDIAKHIVKVNIKMYKKLKIKMYNFYIDSDSSESNFILFLILYELPFILII